MINLATFIQSLDPVYTGLVTRVQVLCFIGNMLSWLSFHNFVW